MKIVFDSPNFFPLTGGLENLVMDLAIELSLLGHSVTLFTRTPGAGPDDFGFDVLRRPGLARRLQRLAAADVLVQFNVSLKGLLSWLPARPPLVVSHQTPNTDDWRGRLKSWVANHWCARNIGCSAHMSRPFRHAQTIPNPYNQLIFKNFLPWNQRKSELLFVGRLVSDKGVDVLLQALAILAAEGLRPALKVVGAGPEEIPLKKLCALLGLDNQVSFAGLLREQALAAIMNEHRILVVPSTWEEPFGIVALEGLACGCWLIGSSGGGLPEAIGPGGAVFPNGDAAALAACLRDALLQPENCVPDPEKIHPHLERHHRSAIAREYAAVLENLVVR
ncbi:MAG: glycosyltransferase family 4 protein [Saprospiraceae bacterium]|nr:glycosyltransferase family 4 protein [Saprospiraceae bacterium]